MQLGLSHNQRLNSPLAGVKGGVYGGPVFCRAPSFQAQTSALILGGIDEDDDKAIDINFTT